MPDEPGRTILDNIVSARRRTLEETRLAVPLKQVQRWRRHGRSGAILLRPSLRALTLAPRRGCA